MYVREKPNKSGSTSVQIIRKERGRSKVVKTVGCATEWREIEQLKKLGQQQIIEISRQASLFPSHSDKVVEDFVASLDNSSIQTIGPELVFGSIFNHIGFNRIKSDLFRHLVISRLAFPLSKLKTIDYIHRYQGVLLDIDAVYRFLDKLNGEYKAEVEQIAYNHTLKLLGGQISVVFYDMTTLHFEAIDEDDLRRTGFSKIGKHQKPQILIGLLVGPGGYAIGYDIFEGNTYEGHTLIPFLENMRQKFGLDKPVVVADAALLSNKNIEDLQKQGYAYILGARIKNEESKIKQHILSQKFVDGQTISIKKQGATRLVVSYCCKRAKKDAYNRQRGLTRLEKKIKTGRLTKSNINNRGYNKYLKLTGDVSIVIDYNKYHADQQWDGLKGYITNTRISDRQVLENYGCLWHVERAFRMSKADLQIRPIYHRLKERIQAHICIAFVAYCIYKELERVLYEHNSVLSVKKAAELTQNMYQITYTLPKSKHSKTKLLKMDEKQQELYNIIQNNYQVSQR